MAARRGQGAHEPVRGQVPERHRRRPVPRLRELDQAGAALAAGDDPPDVFAGNQGYQLDGELVKAGLILPLDKYAEAYGWEESFTPETLQQFSGATTAPRSARATCGVAQTGQSSASSPTRRSSTPRGSTRGARDVRRLPGRAATLRESLPADEPVIALGNKDQYGAIHLWGGIQGAYTPAQDVRDWIFHQDGATFDTEGNLKSLQVLKEWADKGYLGQGDSFNAATTPRRLPPSARARARW